MPRTKKKKSLTDQVKSTSKKPVEPPEELDTSVLVPTGSTLLNLACSDRPEGGFVPGKMVNVIGDSHSGKTLELLSMFAEVAHLKHFDPYKLLEDDAEEADEFNIRRLFGQVTQNRVTTPPNGTSHTTQQFQDNLLTALKKYKHFIYGLDSFDAICPEEEEEKAESDMEARAKGNQVKGTYGMEKAKQASQLLRLICSSLKKTKSLLVIVSQTRDNVDPFTFAKRSRSGGRALRFYACHEIWLAVVGMIHKTVHGKKYPIGAKVRAKITKNKITGKVREVDFSVYYDYGIDDVGSCVDYLIAEGVFEKEGKTCFTTTHEFNGMIGPRASIIEYIEEENLELKLTKLVAATWAEIEESLKLNRKPKYT